MCQNSARDSEPGLIPLKFSMSMSDLAVLNEGSVSAQAVVMELKF